MSLKDAEIRAFRPRDTSYKKADEKGLYLEINPNGSKYWRLKYRFNGREKKLALGTYPEVGLAAARAKRDAARAQLTGGQDPSFQRKREKVMAQISAGNTFGGVADEFIATKLQGEGKSDATLVKARWFLDLLRPALGERPISEIEPSEILAPLKTLERKGHRETARRVRAFASRVFRYGVATDRCKADPAALLQGALMAPKVTHHAAILEPLKLGELLRAVDCYTGSPITKFAMLLAPHVFVRPGELRHAEWGEFDRRAAIWRIPAGKMKQRRPHSVPLSRQVLELLDELEPLTGAGRYLFPSLQTLQRPMSENTMNAAFRRMGFARTELTAHGLRATASTLLNESGKWSPDAIERALAHGESDAVRGAYHRGQHWQERVKMAQWWSDHLDALRSGAEIIELHVPARAGND